MKLAEKFQLPILTFIDTPGAYPGIKAEEHNQVSDSHNLFDTAELNTDHLHRLVKAVQVVRLLLGSAIEPSCSNTAFIQSFHPKAVLHLCERCKAR